MARLRGPRGLIALNAALLLVLGVITLAPASHAQRGAAAARARGEYTMVSGSVVGSSVNAVYVVDANNQEMLAMLWNQSTRNLDVIGYRDLRADSGPAAR